MKEEKGHDEIGLDFGVEFPFCFLTTLRAKELGQWKQSVNTKKRRSTQGIFLTRRNRDVRTPQDFPEVTENLFLPFC